MGIFMGFNGMEWDYHPLIIIYIYVYHYLYIYIHIYIYWLVVVVEPSPVKNDGLNSSVGMMT